mgnify:CR=1 FL=1
MKKHKYLFVACLSLFPVMAVAGNDTLHEIMEVPSATNINKNRLYKGKVVDDRTSEPLVGATVKVKGSTIGTITDIDGNFALDIPDNISPIVFEVSYMGYASKEAAPAKTTGFTIRLAEDSQTLEEVQIIAYGKQSKMSVTAAISSIDTKELLKSPSGSVANALSGAVTGLSSIQPSGQPGAENPSIYIRGTGSLSDELSKPLILVDGVERSFFQMDSHEIESITVLKDAASTAVFGVRGANGVVLVTTRRGVSGKPVISLNSSFGLTQALRNLKGVDSYTYATLYNEAQLSDNPSLTESQLGFSPFVIDMFRTNEDPIMFPNVDWNDYLFKNLAWQTQHNLTLSGGGERFRYFVSLGYLLQDGMLKQLGESYDPNYQYKRFNYRSNVDIDITKSTLLKVNIGGHVGAKREPRTDELWRKVLWSTPFSSPGIVDGKLISNIYSNRYISIGERSCPLDYYYNYGYNVDTDNVLNLDLALEQKLDFITPGLSMNIKGAYNTNYNVKASRTPSGADSMCTPIYLGSIETPGMDFWDPRFDRTIVYQTDGVSGLHEQMSYGEEVGRGRNWYGEFSLNYSRSFGDHDVSALFLYNQSKKYYPETKIDGKVFYMDIPTAYVGYVGRMTYAYKKRYMVDLNAGYNGSENFAPDKRFGFFPAVSAGWILSEEKFMKKQKVIDFLKLRASYGIVGNDKMENARFLYMAGAWSGYNTVAKGQGSWQFGKDGGTGLLPDAKENTMGNPDVTWETVEQTNIGLDFGFLNNTIYGELDWYSKDTKDILLALGIPHFIGLDAPEQNAGVVRNSGVEAMVGFRKTFGEFTFNTSFNLAYNKNEWIDRGGDDKNISGYNIQTIGSPLNAFYIYQADGLIANEQELEEYRAKYKSDPRGMSDLHAGDVKLVDTNNDGTIDPDDRQIFASNIPKFTYGWNISGEYKGFDLSLLFQGSSGANRMMYGEWIEGPSYEAFTGVHFRDRWTEENQNGNAEMPRLEAANNRNASTYNSFFLKKTNYLRLKNAQLGYTFSKGITDKLRITKLRLYVSGSNLLTFSSLYQGLDPEGKSDRINDFPPLKIVNFGVNIIF